MASGWKSAWAVVALLGTFGLGCVQHYDEDPGPVGLSGHDVKAATDKMAADLLSSAALNASRTQWTIVVGQMRDETTDRTFASNYNIFLARLKVKLSELSNGRITLIQNKASFKDLRSRELDTPSERDDFGQTSGRVAVPVPAAIQPDYELNGVAHDLPNRGSNYYQLEFDIQSTRDRTIPWTREYEVTLPR